MATYDRSNAAYDFDRFDPAKKTGRQPETAPQPRIVKPKRRTQAEIRQDKLRSYSRAAKLLIAFAAAVCMISVNLSYRASINELNNRIVTATKSLNEAKSEYTWLNASLTAKISVANVRNYAENVLGMVKKDRYQIIYIDLDSGNEIIPAG